MNMDPNQSCLWRKELIYLSQVCISSAFVSKPCAVFRSVGIRTTVPSEHRTLLPLEYWYFPWVSRKSDYNKSLWESPVSSSLLESPTSIDLGVISSEIGLKREIGEAQIEDDTWSLFFKFSPSTPSSLGTPASSFVDSWSLTAESECFFILFISLKAYLEC